MKFIASDPLSIGVEMEFQLVDAQSLDLVDGIIPLMDLYPDSRYVKPEFIQNTVEIASRVCYSLQELESHLKAQVKELQDKCRALGMRLCGAGTHPFGQRLALVTPFPHYLKMEREQGYISHTQITFSTHVHIGVASGEEAIRVMRQLQVFLPLLIALSASSPFWRGYETGFASYRHRILAASRSFGLPPAFADWADFQHFFSTARRAGVFETIHSIHWDIRPRPHLGTLEVRVMDAQSSVRDAVSLAGFVRALLTYLKHTDLQERPPALAAPMPWWIEKNNHFEASRLGLEAKFVQDEAGTVRKLKDVACEVLSEVAVTASELGQQPYTAHLERLLEAGVSYQRQRMYFQHSNSCKEVTAFLLQELEAEESG